MTRNRERPVQVKARDESSAALRRSRTPGAARSQAATDRCGLSEAELLLRATDGDHDAIGRLLSIHQDTVFTLALRLVGDRELAADIAQETLVRAWRALPGFRGDAQLSTWLHRITVNTAWTMRKRWVRGETTPLDSLAEMPAVGGIDPEQAGVDIDLSDRIAEALRQLSPKLRSVVVLKDIYDWSHPEIAEHLDISVTAAKVRLHRGRALLRAELELRAVRP